MPPRSASREGRTRPGSSCPRRRCRDLKSGKRAWRRQLAHPREVQCPCGLPRARREPEPGRGASAQAYALPPEAGQKRKEGVAVSFSAGAASAADPANPVDPGNSCRRFFRCRHVHGPTPARTSARCQRRAPIRPGSQRRPVLNQIAGLSGSGRSGCEAAAAPEVSRINC